MIKKSITISLFSLLICSCKQEGNKGIIENDNKTEVQTIADNGQPDQNIGYNTDINGKKTVKTDYVYQATDKTLVKVKFDYSKDKGSVSITNNNKTFTLDKVTSDGKETKYENQGMEVTVKGDSLILKQGGNIIELVKTKI